VSGLDGLADVPPRQALRWVERVIGPGARVVRSAWLHGGITAAIHAVEVVDRDDARHDVVLRRWLPADSAVDLDAHEAALLVEREAHALRALEERAPDVPAPRLLAHDPTGSVAGTFAVLMTRVPGQVDLTPADPESWLRQLAATLARIHALAIEAQPFELWYDPERASGPPDARDRGVWRRARAVARASPGPDDEQTFIHRDYQHFNVLWQDGRLSGVVDWTNAATGPPALDVGHCRLNLAVLFSAEWAERFRVAYEAEAGRAIDPRWDITALLSFGPEWPRTIPAQVAGRAPFDAAGAVDRVEATLAAALDRL
jgi:aminoglycoside phosphotransferase (APT) family kinase protein